MTFLRPAWLFVVFPALWMFYKMEMKCQEKQVWRRLIDEHLYVHLVDEDVKQKQILPHRLLGVIWLLTILALAGPSWQFEEAPFSQHNAAVVVIFELRNSLNERDLQPSRLKRAVLELRDLIALSPGTQFALVAYAGSAHLVMPLTTDGDIVSGFANELAPDIMPKEGESLKEALELSEGLLTRAKAPGTIVLFTDGIDNVPKQKLRFPLHIVEVTKGRSLKEEARQLGAAIVSLAPDDSDMKALAASLQHDFTRSTISVNGGRRKDGGYWLIPLIVLLSLFWSRAGWAVTLE